MLAVTREKIEKKWSEADSWLGKLHSEVLKFHKMARAESSNLLQQGSLVCSSSAKSSTPGIWMIGVLHNVMWIWEAAFWGKHVWGVPGSQLLAFCWFCSHAQTSRHHRVVSGVACSEFPQARTALTGETKAGWRSASCRLSLKREVAVGFDNGFAPVFAYCSFFCSKSQSKFLI